MRSLVLVALSDLPDANLNYMEHGGIPYSPQGHSRFISSIIMHHAIFVTIAHKCLKHKRKITAENHESN